eukprot:TRINITY_DN65418_c0_g1_i1.p1 TRINITY_DN65418_c0_g1~~TRINITY_DN65418_c0_g1_i1.p1  ORF type:complete len:763 (+),score=165.70 TRINITY_DN65418_c0_g1_i1:83-2371(+)
MAATFDGMHPNMKCSKRPAVRASVCTATAAMPPAAPKPKDASACPICSVELHAKREELGALTNGGKRMERTLYHSSCITLMLAHSGGMIHRPGSRQGFEISWGLSPVTRQAVDGFCPMPSLADQQSWLRFVDWRGTGCVDVEDLAAVCAAILPIEESDSVTFVRKRFRVAESDSMSETELALHVFPYLERECPELCRGQRSLLNVVTPFMQAAASLRLVNQEPSIYALRGASKYCSGVAQVLLVQCLLAIAERVVQSPSSYGGRVNPSSIATAVGLISPPGETCVLRFFNFLLEVSEELRELAVETLPHITAGGTELSSSYAFALVAGRLQHRSPDVRIAALSVLYNMRLPEKFRVMQVVLSQLGDKDSSVKVAALETLGKMVARGDQTVIKAVLQQLETDQDMKFQVAAEELLATVAKGDENSVSLLCSKLADGGTEDSRVQALRVLGLIAEAGDRRVLLAAMPLLRLPSPPPRNAAQPPQGQVVGRAADGRLLAASAKLKVAAMQTLRKVAVKGDKLVLRAVCPAVHEKYDFQVVEMAIRTVAAVACGRDLRAARVLGTVFTDQYKAVFQGPHYRVTNIRAVALEALAQIGEGGCQYIFELSSPMVKDQDIDVRRKAADCVASVVRRGDQAAIRLLKEVSMNDQDAQVRSEAKRALDGLGEPIPMSRTHVCGHVSVFAAIIVAALVLFVVSANLLRNFLEARGASYIHATIVSILLHFIAAVVVKRRRRIFSRCCPKCFKSDISAQYDPEWWRLDMVFAW